MRSNFLIGHHLIDDANSVALDLHYADGTQETVKRHRMAFGLGRLVHRVNAAAVELGLNPEECLREYLKEIPEIQERNQRRAEILKQHKEEAA